MTVTGEQIRESLRAAPFKPFRLHLVDQRVFEVRHPDFALVSPNRRLVLVFPLDNPEVCRMIDVSLIVSLEPIDDQPMSSQAA
jgi:hypothetical protein